MIAEPVPHLTNAGKYLLYALGLAVGVIVVSLMVNACIRRPVVTAERGWTQGYEHPAGYMEPDHGWFYYWMMTRALQQNVQPTYHVYQPPPNYPPTYRPWQADEYMRLGNTYVRKPESAVTPARTSGGFSERPATPPAAPSKARTSGGFAPTKSSQPPPKASPPPSRTAPASPSPRQSGGFAPSSAPARPSPSPRQSGGFSKR